MRILVGLLLISCVVTPSLAQNKAEIDSKVAAATISVGDLEARLSSTATIGDPAVKTPGVQVLVGGKPVLSMTDENGTVDTPIAAVRIAELDNANDSLEVVFTAYSGGAHCCTSVQIATKSGTEWKVVTAGPFDGGGDYLADIDGDGSFEIVTRDNDFLYAFDCYACSLAPMKYLAITAAQAKDVSKEDKFRPEFENQLLEARKDYDADARVQAGFLVGELGIRLRLGDGDKAWSDFERAAARAKIAAVDRCPDNAADCPADQQKPVPFTKAVRSFMKATGYAN